MDGWKWNLDISIIFLSKSRDQPHDETKFARCTATPSDTYTTHPLVHLVPYSFLGEELLAAGSSILCGQTLLPFKSLCSLMAGRHVPPNSVRSKWEFRSTEVSEDGPPASLAVVGILHRGAELESVCSLSPSVMLLFILRGYTSN